MIYIVTLTEWNVVGYDDVETFEHGRWCFTDDMKAMSTLLEILIREYHLELTAPNTWEWGGEFKGLVLHMSMSNPLNMSDVLEITPPTFTWFNDAEE